MPMLSYHLSKAKISLCTCPAVKMATFLSFWPRKAMLLVGKLFSCSAFPVARSKIQYRTQFPVFKTACTPSETYKCKKIYIYKNLLIFNNYLPNVDLSGHICKSISTDAFYSIMLHTEEKNCQMPPNYFIPFTNCIVLSVYRVCHLKYSWNIYLWNLHSLLIFLFFQVCKAF